MEKKKTNRFQNDERVHIKNLGFNIANPHPFKKNFKKHKEKLLKKRDKLKEEINKAQLLLVISILHSQWFIELADRKLIDT